MSDNETGVESVLCALLARDEPLDVDVVAAELEAGQQPQLATVSVAPVNLHPYDALLGHSLSRVGKVAACLP